MKPSVAIEKITPSQAREILENSNSENFRTLRPSYVRDLAKSLKEGMWDTNGEAIIFDTKGNLLDGQHRLAACFEAGKPIESVVVRGVNPMFSRTIDTGMKRSVAQFLTSHGIKFSTNVASAYRLYRSYMLGDRSQEVFHGRIDAQEIMDFLTPGRLEQMYDDIHSLAPVRRFASLSLLVGMAMIGREFYPREKVTEWALNVANSAGPMGSSAQKLAKRLHEENARVQSGHGNRWTQALLMARSMKFHCEGIKVDKLMAGRGKSAVLPEFATHSKSKVA